MERGGVGGGGGGGDERTVYLWFSHRPITINFRATDGKYGHFTFIF